jgi:hypothetical protein
LESVYGILYLIFLAGAVIFTVIRPRSMVLLMWPVVFLYPYAWIRSNSPFFIMGLHDFYILGCGLLALADYRKIREGFALSDPSISTFILLLVFQVVAHLWSTAIFLMRFPDESWLIPLRTFTSDIRCFVPGIVAVAYLRDERQIRRAVLWFGLFVLAAFGLVIADRFGSFVFRVFNHTTYQSTVALSHYRSVGGFGGPWEVGAVGAASIVFLLYLVVTRGYLNRLLGIVAVATIGVGIVFSLSRSGIMATVTGAVAVLAFSGFRARFRALIVVGIAFLVMSSLRFGDERKSYDLANLVEDRMSTAYRGGELSDTAESRVSIWNDQLDHMWSGQMSWSEIFLGHGGMIGSARVFGATTHNGFIGPFFYYGILGAVLLLGTWGFMLMRAFRLWVTRSSSQILALLGTSMVGMLGNEFLSSLAATYVLGFAIAIFSLLLGREGGLPAVAAGRPDGGLRGTTASRPRPGDPAPPSPPASPAGARGPG